MISNTSFHTDIYLEGLDCRLKKKGVACMSIIHASKQLATGEYVGLQCEYKVLPNIILPDLRLKCITTTCTGGVKMNYCTVLAVCVCVCL